MICMSKYSIAKYIKIVKKGRMRKSDIKAIM
jgi:hypothetical protein